MNKKAYAVVIHDPEYPARYSVLAFAESPSKAKALALQSEWLLDTYCRYIDLRCRRLPQADNWRDDFPDGLVEGHSKAELRVLRFLGWRGDGCNSCEECGLDVFDELPESYLCSDDIPVCRECMEEPGIRERYKEEAEVHD